MTTAPKRRRAQPEAALQRQVAAYLDRVLHPHVIWWHAPNGGARDKRTAAMLNRAGVKPGVWHCVVIWPDPFAGGGSRVLGIALKVGRGEISQAQLDWHWIASGAGVSTAVCRSLADVESALKQFYVPLHG